MMCTEGKLASTSATKISPRTYRQVASRVKLRTRFLPDPSDPAVPNGGLSHRICNQPVDTQAASLFICVDSGATSRRSDCSSRTALLLEVSPLECNTRIRRTNSTATSKPARRLLGRASLILFILCSSNLIEALHQQNGHVEAQKMSQSRQAAPERLDSSAKQNPFSADLEQRLEVDERAEAHDTQADLRVDASEQSPAINSQEFSTSSEHNNLLSNFYPPPESAHLLFMQSGSADSQTANISHHAHEKHNRNHRPTTSWRDESGEQQQQQHKDFPKEANNAHFGHPSRRAHGPVMSGSDNLQAIASVSDPRLQLDAGHSSDSHKSDRARLVHWSGRQRSQVAAPSRQTATASYVITAHRMPELTLRQAPSVSALGSTRVAPISVGAAREQTESRAGTPASSEGQWIPIVTISGHDNANRRNKRIRKLVELDMSNRAHSQVAQAPASSQATSALLDFPSKPSPAAPQNVNQLKAKRAQARPGLNQATWPGSSPKQAASSMEAQLTAGSNSRYYASQAQAHAANHYELHQHRHQQRPSGRHRHNQLWHELDNFPPPAYHHRRPRLNSQDENSIEHDAIEFRPNKIYKRVLLCDKTLVSLDYIRNLEAEPRPGGAIQFLNEHEINEIADNFMPGELDGTYELIARSDSNSIESGSLTLASHNSSDTRRAATPTNATNSGESAPLLEASGSHSAGLLLERRGFLSDEEPLVRCDMWDLEKGLKSRKPPEGILRLAVKADFETVREAINRCRQLSERTLPPDDEYRDGLEIMSSEDLVSLFSVKRGLIPGTKWCGLGDQANSYNDLGQKHRIDICCRAHDHCPIRSKPFRNDYGILNIGLYTKSHCDCDADFYRCLREVHSRTADMLGNLYFNVMKLQCMREERLKICREMKPIALGFERCVRYEESPIKRVFKFTTPPVAY